MNVISLTHPFYQQGSIQTNANQKDVISSLKSFLI